MVDNFELILPLLRCSHEDLHLHSLMLLQRSSDRGGGRSRLIKTYYVYNREYLVEREAEIKAICEACDARAQINLNVKSARRTAFRVPSKIMARLEDKQGLDNIHKIYDSVLNASPTVGDKHWIIDIDAQDIDKVDKVQKFLSEFTSVLGVIPSKTGVHFIVQGFDPRPFKDEFPSISVCKDALTNLYIPDERQTH